MWSYGVVIQLIRIQVPPQTMKGRSTLNSASPMTFWSQNFIYVCQSIAASALHKVMLKVCSQDAYRTES